LLSEGGVPGNGIVTVLATTRGEETFIDANGNGIYDSGEIFFDIPEPFIDFNGNGRFDGPEPFTDSNANGRHDNGEPFTDTILEAFAGRPFVDEQRGAVPLAASVGIATFPGDGRTATDLIARADAALYGVKRSGGRDAAAASGIEAA
jgi:hypothetical protein